MLKFTYENRATISLFLVIIMFSTMALSGIIIDGARQNAADAMAKSAGENAAVSTLAGFNTDLKDKYGLFAMKYNDDSEATNIFKYYFDSMIGGEAQQDQIDSIISNLTENDRFKDKKVLDLFRLSTNCLSTNMVYPLADPVVLRSQIMEFSKYRMPVFFAESALGDALANVDKVSKDSELMEKQQKKSRDASEFLDDAEKLKEKVETANNNLNNLKNTDAIQSGHISDFNTKKQTHDTAKENQATAENNLQSANTELETARNNAKSIFTGDETKEELEQKKVEMEERKTALSDDRDKRIKENTWSEQDETDYKDAVEDINKDIEDINGKINIIELQEGFNKEVNNAKNNVKNAEKDKQNADTAEREAEEAKLQAVETIKGDRDACVQKLKDIKTEIDGLISEIPEMINTQNNLIAELEAHRDECNNEKNCSSDENGVTTGQNLATQTTDLINQVKDAKLADGKTALQAASGKIGSAISEIGQMTIDENSDMSIVADDIDRIVGDIPAVSLETHEYETTPENEEKFNNFKNKATDKSSEANKNSTDNDGKEYFKIENIDSLPSHKEISNRLAEFEADDKNITDKAQSYLSQQMDDITDYSNNEKKTVDIKIDGENTTENTADTNNLFKALKNAASTAADSLVINEYAMNMFKNRTTEIVYDKNTVDEDAKYAVKSKFEAQENLRWQTLNDTDTKLKYGEVEYIIWGNESEKFNIDAVYSEILIMRIAVNTTAILLDREAVNLLSEISACAGPFAGLVMIALVVTWATAESLIEMDKLVNKAYKIALFKKCDIFGTKGNMFLNIDNLLDGEPGEVEYRKSDVMFSYEDYLRLRLLITPMEKRLKRMADLIQLNTDVDMATAYTYIRVKTNVSMPYLFMTSVLLPTENRFEKGRKYDIENVFYQGY